MATFTPTPLKFNCGYARTAIRELTPKKTGRLGRNIDTNKRSSDFKQLFADISLPEGIFQTDCKGNSKFNKHCNSIFDMFSKKWNPIVKAEYEATFSIDNWKRLPVNDKKEHSLSFCSACSTNHTQLQKAFPGKPVFYSEQSISLSLPVTPSHSKTEKLEVRRVLGDLNRQWENRYGHSYSSVVTKLAPEANLTKKKTKLELKQQNRKTKRKIANHINQQLSENTTLTVLAEAESMQAYRRKRNAMSFEVPTTPNKNSNLHSPSDDKHTWSHEDATALLLSHPAEKNQLVTVCKNTADSWSKCWSNFESMPKNKVLMSLLCNTKVLRLLNGFAGERKSYPVVKFRHRPYRPQQPLRLTRRL